MSIERLAPVVLTTGLVAAACGGDTETTPREQVRVAINNATDLCFEQEQPDVVEQFPVNENDPTTEIDEAYEARQKATDPDNGAIATLNQLVANCVEAELGGIEGYDIVIPSDLLDLVREELELGDQ